LRRGAASSSKTRDNAEKIRLPTQESQPQAVSRAGPGALSRSACDQGEALDRRLVGRHASWAGILRRVLDNAHGIAAKRPAADRSP
jgi:hypothetical protein